VAGAGEEGLLGGAGGQREAGAGGSGVAAAGEGGGELGDVDVALAAAADLGGAVLAFGEEDADFDLGG